MSRREMDLLDVIREVAAQLLGLLVRQVKRLVKRYRVRGATVTVCEGFDGTVSVPRGGRALPNGKLALGEGTLLLWINILYRLVD